MISFENDKALEKMMPSWVIENSYPDYKLLDSVAKVENIGNYNNLYDYLESEYLSNEEIRFNYDLDRFMSEWIEDNISSDAMYESIVGTHLLGYHYRNYNINHKTRTIELFAGNSEIGNKEKEHLSMSITAAKDKIYKMFVEFKEDK